MTMPNLDRTLTAIAHGHLGIPTLEGRNSDSLDFHEVSVWGVKAALTAAYEAGVKEGYPERRKLSPYRRNRIKTDSTSC
jgi:hypothetical protein